MSMVRKRRKGFNRMTLIALGISESGKLSLVADKLIGDHVRRFDKRRKISRTPNGYVFGISGANYAVDRSVLARHIDDCTVMDFMIKVNDRYEEIGVIVINGGNVETFHSSGKPGNDVKYGNIMSTGSMMGTGDLFWMVRDLYNDGEIPNVEDLVNRMNLIHKCIGDDRPVDVLESDFAIESLDDYEAWALADF